MLIISSQISELTQDFKALVSEHKHKYTTNVVLFCIPWDKLNYKVISIFLFIVKSLVLIKIQNLSFISVFIYGLTHK